MVVLLPRLMKGDLERDVLAEASSLLCSIGGHAQGDLRFLDAFNRYYEVIDSMPTWRQHPDWSKVLGVYKRVIEHVLENLERGVTPSIAAFWPAGREQQVMQYDEAPPCRILVLADNSLVASRILDPVALVSGVEVSVLICNSHRSMVYFLLRQLAALARAIQTRRFKFLRSLAKHNWKVSVRSLDSQAVLTWIRKGWFDVGLHGMGVIYRRPLLDMFRFGVLNAHIGYLPAFRGRSVLEWSLLAGCPPGITVFFIDEGIDTGERIVTWQEAARPFPQSLDKLKRRLFDMDGQMYALSLRMMQLSNGVLRRNVLDQGRRYFEMSELLRSVVAKVMASQMRTRSNERETR